MPTDPKDINEVLINAKMHLDNALERLGLDASSISTARSKRVGLDDQNTGCQNSGCGGGAMAKVDPIKTQPGV